MHIMHVTHAYPLTRITSHTHTLVPKMSNAASSSASSAIGGAATDWLGAVGTGGAEVVMAAVAAKGVPGALCTVLTMHCTRYVLYSLCTVHYALYSLCTVLTMHCTHYALCTMYCALCTVLTMYCTHYALYSLCTIPTMHYTHYVLYSLCTVHYVLYSLCTVLTMHCTHYALYSLCTILTILSLTLSLTLPTLFTPIPPLSLHHLTLSPPFFPPPSHPSSSHPSSTPPLPTHLPPPLFPPTSHPLTPPLHITGIVGSAGRAPPASAVQVL
jgi:hypothetical protein